MPTPIDEIPADTELVMTADLRRCFLVAGCDPACHCCDKDIKDGATFKLAQIDTMDKMLCSRCTPRMFRNARARQRQFNLSRGGSGYERQHTTVTLVPALGKRVNTDRW